MTHSIRLPSLLMFLGAVSTGCLRESTGPAGTAAVAGSWQFNGLQTAGAGTSLVGTLVLQSQSLTSYTGTLDVVATIPGSGSQRLAGPVAGRVVSGTAVDFSASLGGTQRQHIGTLKADTISGTWLETSGNTLGASGTFRAVRTSR